MMGIKSPKDGGKRVGKDERFKYCDDRYVGERSGLLSAAN